MIIVDSFLIDLDNTKTYTTNNQIPKRDRRILSSLSRQLKSGAFLTKNQSDLLIKILKENLSNIDSSMLDLDNPMWSKEFRVIDQVKKIHIDSNYIVVEFTFSKRIKQIVTDLNKIIDGQLLSNGSKQYLIPLSEKNIFVTLNALKKERFDIQPLVLDYYKEINSILENNEDIFNFDKISNERLFKQLNADIDISNPLQVIDRRLAYQYSHTLSKDNSIAAKIANRKSTKVYINSETISLEEIFSALKDLNRFPLLVIFNQYETKEIIKELQQLRSATLGKNVGVYFRLDNSSTVGKEFNFSIKEYKFNDRLNPKTDVVGLTNNHLPKFIFRSGWYPKTVISFTNNFKNNKTSAFCDAVDLVIYYNKSAPIGGNVDEIV